ncbi:zf-HC2 domain-containing protein [Kineosporiaceae bacterium SCSIO 59966]|nr:zf-HC2 domain-containing protein [Kineosporiaceae bacterium SCSIO 59966]
MNHLGDRVTDLVDGRLSPDAAERAVAHLAGCQDCRAEVAAERAVRNRLATAAAPAPPDGLVDRLVRLGGPTGPLPPRTDRVPGTPAPAPVPWPRRDPRRRSLALAGAGALSAAVLGLVALTVLGSVAGTAPEPVAVLADMPGRSVSAGSAPAGSMPAEDLDAEILDAEDLDAEDLDAEDLDALRAEGWPCPPRLDDRLHLVQARSLLVDGNPVLQLTYSDGRATVSVIEERGRIGPADAAARVAVLDEVLAAAARSGGGHHVPWHGVWQSGDVVVTVVADDAPPEVLDRLVEILPQRPADEPGLWERVGQGADVVGALLSGS